VIGGLANTSWNESLAHPHPGTKHVTSILEFASMFAKTRSRVWTKQLVTANRSSSVPPHHRLRNAKRRLTCLRSNAQRSEANN
jgi:hypothetical protein